MANSKLDCFRLDSVLGLLTREKNSIYKDFGVIDLAVFGSYAKNEQHKESDVDIFVKLKQEYKTFDNFMELRFFLEETLGRKVDLVTQEAIREELKPKIFWKQFMSDRDWKLFLKDAPSAFFRFFFFS